MFRWFGWFLYTINTIFRSTIFGHLAAIFFNGHRHFPFFSSNHRITRLSQPKTALFSRIFFKISKSTLLSCLVTCVYVNPQCRAPRAGVCRKARPQAQVGLDHACKLCQQPAKAAQTAGSAQLHKTWEWRGAVFRLEQ